MNVMLLLSMAILSLLASTHYVDAEDTDYRGIIELATISNISKLATILPPSDEPTAVPDAEEGTAGDSSSPSPSLGRLPAINLFPSDNNISTVSPDTNNLTSSFSKYIDESIQGYNLQASNIMAKISSSTFTLGDGKVIDLINSIAYLRGQVEVSGAGYSILHFTEQALIDKINEVGPSAFSPSEQSYITTWVNRLMLEQEEEKRYATVLPGFN